MKDMFGNEIQKFDILVSGQRRGNGGEMAIGIVTQVNEKSVKRLRLEKRNWYHEGEKWYTGGIGNLSTPGHNSVVLNVDNFKNDIEFFNLYKTILLEILEEEKTKGQ